TLHGLLLLDTLDHESIMERFQCNCHFSRTSFCSISLIRIKTSASCKRKFTLPLRRIICPRKQREHCSHVATHFRMREIRRSHVRLDASGASPDLCASAHSAEMHICCLHWRPNECGKDDFLYTSLLTSASKKVVELPKEGVKATDSSVPYRVAMLLK